MKIEITNGGHFKCLIEIKEDNTVELLGAINGWGDSCVEDVTIEVKEEARKEVQP